MVSDKLGFTFYPQNWWASDSFFDMNITQRYLWLEFIFIMNMNDGYMKTQKTQIENRLRVVISDEDWTFLTSKLTKTEFGFTHISVNKRLRKTVASRENGRKGGRPKNPENPKAKPTEKPTKNLSLEREREREVEYIPPTSEYGNPTPPTLQHFQSQKISAKMAAGQCEKDRIWLDSVSMTFKIKLEDMPAKLSEFTAHCVNTGKAEKDSIGDFKQHFVAWLRKKDQDYKPGNQIENPTLGKRRVQS